MGLSERSLLEERMTLEATERTGIEEEIRVKGACVHSHLLEICFSGSFPIVAPLTTAMMVAALSNATYHQHKSQQIPMK